MFTSILGLGTKVGSQHWSQEWFLRQQWQTDKAAGSLELQVEWDSGFKGQASTFTSDSTILTSGASKTMESWVLLKGVPNMAMTIQKTIIPRAHILEGTDCKLFKLQAASHKWLLFIHYPKHDYIPPKLEYYKNIINPIFILLICFL